MRDGRTEGRKDGRTESEAPLPSAFPSFRLSVRLQPALRLHPNPQIAEPTSIITGIRAIPFIRFPVRSEIPAIIVGLIASPRRWIERMDMLTARARIAAGTAFTMMALIGPL